jgi:hypothetical protein
MSEGSRGKAARIRQLNDQLRCKSVGGRVVITRGIEALGSRAAANALAAVAGFDNFCEDNDPWGEPQPPTQTVFYGRSAVTGRRGRRALTACGALVMSRTTQEST